MTSCSKTPCCQYGYVFSDVAQCSAPSHTTPKGAFSQRFAEHGVNHWKLFAPDIMHEFDLGVWKAIFTHLLRLLDSLGREKLNELDCR